MLSAFARAPTNVVSIVLWTVQGYLALCLAVQNAVLAEVLEWVNWHQLAGVDRFVVFDLGSAAPLDQVHFTKDRGGIGTDEAQMRLRT